MFVRCIDDSGTNCLIKDKEYIAVDQGDAYFLPMHQNAYSKERFDVVTGGNVETVEIDERSGTVARKFDAGKLRYDLVPLDALEEITRVLTHGANKYGDWNWLQGDGLAWSRLIGATYRHFMDWVMGETKDKETGMNNLAHCICCLLFLLTYQLREKGSDDRQYQKTK